MEEKKRSATEQDEADRIARAGEFQRKEAERKQRHFDSLPSGMRKVLREARSKICAIDQQARDRIQMSASWTDPTGRLRRRTGTSFSLDADISNSPDLFVRDNLRSVRNITRSCQRAMKMIDDLLDVLQRNREALPVDLKNHVDQIVSDIPSLDSIKLETTREPEQGAPGAAKGSAKV
jgi:hypothetical protein